MSAAIPIAPAVPVANQDIDNIHQQLNTNVTQVAQHNRNIIRLSSSLEHLGGIVGNSLKKIDKKHFNQNQKIEELTHSLRCSFNLHIIQLIAFLAIVAATIYLFSRVSVLSQISKA